MWPYQILTWYLLLWVLDVNTSSNLTYRHLLPFYIFFNLFLFEIILLKTIILDIIVNNYASTGLSEILLMYLSYIFAL